MPACSQLQVNLPRYAGAENMFSKRPCFAPLTSIIGAEGLNGRVRDGNGCDPLAITTMHKFLVIIWLYKNMKEQTHRKYYICVNNIYFFDSFLMNQKYISRNKHAVSDQVNGSISTGQLSVFRYTHVHLLPINLLVLKGAHGENSS